MNIHLTIPLTRALPFVVYLFAGLVLGYVNLLSLMWGVWGAPVTLINTLAVLAAVPLFASAVLAWVHPTAAQLLSLAGLAGMAPLWIPAVTHIVPKYGVFLVPAAYLVYLFYVAVVTFALLFPRRWPWSLPALVVFFAILAGVAGGTAAARYRAGEYDHPAFGFYYWTPGEAGLLVEADPDGWIDAQTRRELAQAHVSGTLTWAGSGGDRSASHRVIVLAQRPPSEAFPLPFPRQGTLIHAFDGTRWQSIPAHAPVYSRFAMLRPGDAETWLEDRTGGGTASTPAFRW